MQNTQPKYEYYFVTIRKSANVYDRYNVATTLSTEALKHSMRSLYGEVVAIDKTKVFDEIIGIII